MQKKFGEFHVGESLEYALDMDRALFAPARVVRVTEHILCLEVEAAEGVKRRILGTGGDSPVFLQYYKNFVASQYFLFFIGLRK